MHVGQFPSIEGVMEKKSLGKLERVLLDEAT